MQADAEEEEDAEEDDDITKEPECIICHDLLGKVRPCSIDLLKILGKLRSIQAHSELLSPEHVQQGAINEILRVRGVCAFVCVFECVCVCECEFNPQL